MGIVEYQDFLSLYGAKRLTPVSQQKRASMEILSFRFYLLEITSAQMMRCIALAHSQDKTITVFAAASMKNVLDRRGMNIGFLDLRSPVRAQRLTLVINSKKIKASIRTGDRWVCCGAHQQFGPIVLPIVLFGTSNFAAI